MTAEVTKYRATRLSQKEQPGCSDHTDGNHGCVIVDEVGINHECDAEEHRFPKVHSFSVDESDKANRSEDKTADQVCRAEAHDVDLEKLDLRQL
jgi:hypothetical protein